MRGGPAGKDEHQEDGHDEAVDDSCVAADVEELFAEHGEDDGWKAEGAGGCGRGGGGRDGSETGRGGLDGLARYGVGCVGEAFSAVLGTHAESEYGEEESGEEGAGEGVDEEAGGGAAMNGEDGGVGELGRETGEHGADVVVDAGCDAEVLGRDAAESVVIVGGVEVEIYPLDSERDGEDEGGEDLARATRGEPAVNPGEDHAGEEDVGRGEDGEREQSVEREGGDGDGDADGDGEGHEGADDVGGREEAEEEADGDVGVDAEGEADELGGVEGGAGLA